MILVFDVGNTETSIGLFNAEELRAHWRIGSDVARTPDEVGVLVQGLLGSAGFDPGSVDGIAIGSVVPPRSRGRSARPARSIFVRRGRW